MSDTEEETDPLMPRKLSRPEPRTYDTTTGVSLFINYIVGTGCFALPFAFGM